jgi:hypothetical protein
MWLQPELIVSNHFSTVIDPGTGIVDEFNFPVGQLKRFSHQLVTDEIAGIAEPVCYGWTVNDHFIVFAKRIYLSGYK